MNTTEKISDRHVRSLARLVARLGDHSLVLGGGAQPPAPDARRGAADFVQDVMIKAYRHLASFKGRSRFSTWLYRVAWNAAAQAKRRKPRYEPLEADPEDASRYSAEELVLRSEAAAALRAAMAELPERYAACVDLYFYHELSLAEIGEVTGFPVNTIKSHVFRAKKQLRTALEGPEERR